MKPVFVNNTCAKLQLWDPEVSRFGRISQFYFRNTTCVIIMFNVNLLVSNPADSEALQNEEANKMLTIMDSIRTALGYITNVVKPCILIVGTAADVKNKPRVSRHKIMQLLVHYKDVVAGYFETSAKENENIAQVFDFAVECAYRNEPTQQQSQDQIMVQQKQPQQQQQGSWYCNLQ